MAGAGAKKRVEENRSRVRYLTIAAITGFVVYLLFRLVLSQSRANAGTWIGLVATSAISWWSLSTIKAYAAPVYDQNGDLVDGGGDLNRKGIIGYSQDVFYITVFVQVGAGLFSSYFFYVYLVVPLYALYMLVTGFILPWLKRRGQKKVEVGPDEATRKRMERSEQRAQRRAQKWR